MPVAPPMMPSTVETRPLNQIAISGVCATLPRQAEAKPMQMPSAR